MPIYQYQCADCQHSLEALQKMSDPKLTDCPACGAASLRKQVTAAAFKLKGTGWYETDFKNSGKKPVEAELSAGSGPSATSKPSANPEPSANPDSSEKTGADKASVDKSSAKSDIATTAGAA